ncbi:MAG: UDP-N-acetylglucosamine 1-carboxyvinyltransferase, partial [Bacillota bacterium]|nr:UDP-N-acetylglucosamine 1-carboxyvinyltransferase [Bacillota bacterium]
SSDESVLHNCPNLSDVDAAIQILRYLGGKIKRESNTLIIDTKGVNRYDIPDGLMREMRSSVVFLGAILARTGRARISFPGGCEIGLRPIDLHLSSLRQMGVEISENRGVLDCFAPEGLTGANILLSFPSVGATENIMLAASLAKGTTVITNAAREPEIVDLADFLIECGANISGAGEGTIVIEGVQKLHGVQHTIIPDRIVAATLLAAGAITGGEIVLNNFISSHIGAVLPIFTECGCHIRLYEGKLKLTAPEKLYALGTIRTMPYPGFPTDAQAPLMAMATVASGTSVFVENIFESRYKHVSEFIRMGAKIKVEGKVAVIEGVQNLYGAQVEAMDLRGAAALVVAALCAVGTTELEGVHYLERGYQDFEGVLTTLGGSVKKI